MDAFQQIMRFICAFWVGLLAAAPAVNAQTAALIPFMPVEGRINAGETQLWTFTAVEGSVWSFLAESAGELDPQISLSSSTGTVLIADDDYDYPNSYDALLQAITIPRTDTYNLTVSGAGGTSGAYSLTLTPGYVTVSQREIFASASPLQTQTAGLTATVDDGQLRLTLNRAGETGTAVNLAARMTSPHYAQVSIMVPNSQNTWAVGLTTRHTSGRYYLLMTNERGQWRFTVTSGGSQQVIREWSAHPAVIVGERSFTLGILVNGSIYELFYNNQLLARVNDTTLSDDGAVGIAVQTPNTPDSRITAGFDGLSVTTPRLNGNAPVIPQQIIIGTPAYMTSDLQRRGLLPPGGDLALLVEESTAESAREGVSRFMLGRGVTFDRFALAAQVRWQAARVGISGCGLIFRSLDDTTYSLAYVDQTGGYGLSRRLGEIFIPGVFGETQISPGSPQHLLVIAVSRSVHYYVNGRYRGVVDIPVESGAVGNAVVNYEPINTACSFSNTWVWRLNP